MRTIGLTAPQVVDGAINGAIVRAYVEQHLVPTLRPDDIVVIDNPAEQEFAGVRGAIESVRADVPYLPPHSPDLNPIETQFSKFKNLLRCAAERSVEALWHTCGHVAGLFHEPESRNHFRLCGYRYP